MALPKIKNIVPQNKTVGGNSGPYIGTLPGSNPAPAWTQAQINASLAANPNASTGGLMPGTFDPSLWGVGNPGANQAPVNYEALITGDPTYGSALTNYNNALTAGRSSLDNQIRAAVIASGYDPTGSMTDNLKDYATAIDPATLAAAAQNPYSAKAQIQTQLDRQLTAMKYRLAARGALQSGAAAVGASLANQTAQQAGYNQMQSLLDAIRGGVGGYTSLQAQQADILRQAREAAAGRYMGAYA